MTPATSSALNTESAQASDVIQPVVVRQTIPPVPSGISGLGSPTASVRVQIGLDGRVINAAMQQASHPLYDRLVLQAARDWLYTPALLNGRPVPSEKVVTIQLR
jgi:TonB family protein